jgi:hypothetical protein
MANQAIINGNEVPRIFTGCNHPVVAAGATANDIVMIHSHHRCEVKRVVAVFAEIGSQDVGRVLADGDDAIVAGDAAVSDVGMVVNGARPDEGAMAVVAYIAADDMVRSFTGCSHAIVAALAGTGDGIVVDPGNGEPRVRLMAVLAVARYSNVLAGGGAGPDQPCSRMTLVTPAGCTGKYCLYVAGFASQRGVFEIQWEAGLIVAEIGAEFERLASARRHQAE